MASSADLYQNLQASLASPMLALWTKLAQFIPNLLAAIILAAVGYLIARVFSVVIRIVLAKVGLDRMGEQSGLREVLNASSLRHTAPSDIVGAIAFWLILLTFVMSAADALGLPQVSASMEKFVFFLPKVLAAAAVLLLGLFIAKFVRESIVTLASGMDSGNAKLVASIVYGFLVVLISTLAIAQLDIDVGLLNDVISIVLISIGAGVALALGLGGKDIAAEVLRKAFPHPTPTAPRTRE